MSAMVSLAYAEMTRVLPWSLRAMGYAFGTADRASHLVATAASLDPASLALVLAGPHRPAATPERCRNEGGLAIDARGVSLIEIGPALIDHLAAHLEPGAILAATVSRTRDLALIPAVLSVGADYAMSSLATGLGPSGEGWAVLDGTGEPRLARGEGGAALREVLVGPARAALDGLGAGLTIVAVGAPVLAETADAVRPREAVARAQARGVLVEAETVTAMYELEKITWAPTSERSRAQAGFQPKPARVASGPAAEGPAS